MNEKKEGILQSAILLSFVSAFSLAFSFIKEAVFAKYFGTSQYADAYTIAIQIPVVLFSVISTAIQTVIIPIYSKLYYNHGKKQADAFASNLMTIVIILTTSIVLVCEVFADIIISLFAPGLSPEVHDLTVQLSRIIFPTMIMTQIVMVNTGILNVYKSFVLPAFAVNFLNFTFLGFIVFLSASYGVYAAAIGCFVGTLLEMFFLIFIAHKRFIYRPYINLRDERLHEALNMSIPVCIGIGAAEINKVVDKIISSFLVEGSIASLNYASKLTSSISSLLITSVSTLVYPQLAQEASQKNKEKLIDVLENTISIFTLIIVPIIAGGYILRYEIISLIFQRGAFDSSSVERTAPLFVCYLATLLFTSYRQVSSRVFYSLGDSKTPMKNSVIGIVINIVLNIVLAKQFGAIGLAVATLISTAVISILILKDINRIVYSLSVNRMVVTVGKCTIASLIMSIAMIFMKKFLSNWNGNMDSFLTMIIYVALMVVFGVIVYFAALFPMKVKELSLLREMVKRRKKK